MHVLFPLKLYVCPKCIVAAAAAAAAT